MNKFDELAIVKSDIKKLQEKKEQLEVEIKSDFIKSLVEFCLPCDATLYWRRSHLAIINNKIEVDNYKPPLVVHKKTRKDYKFGTKFKILKSWKTNKNTKGTHYLLYNPRSKRVANFYG